MLFTGAISGEMQVIASICGLFQVRLNSFFLAQRRLFAVLLFRFVSLHATASTALQTPAVLYARAALSRWISSRCLLRCNVLCYSSADVYSAIAPGSGRKGLIQFKNN